MTIQVFEVSTVPAPEYFLWFFYEGCASRNGLVDDVSIDARQLLHLLAAVGGVVDDDAEALLDPAFSMLRSTYCRMPPLR